MKINIECTVDELLKIASVDKATDTNKIKFDGNKIADIIQELKNTQFVKEMSKSISQNLTNCDIREE